MAAVIAMLLTISAPAVVNAALLVLIAIAAAIAAVVIGSILALAIVWRKFINGTP